MSAKALPDYAIGARLFVGEYGSVHRGVGPVGEDVFALVLASELAARPRFEEELRRASRMLAAFDHPHVLGTELVDVDPGGRLIAITESLADPVALASALRAGGRPPAAVAMAITRELAGALAAAHEGGVVHGALHPRSVFVDREGHTALADFAPARALAETAAAEDIGLFDDVRSYLAPEIDYGERPSPATDVYGFGALVFELWAGRPPPGEIAGPPELRRVIECALRSDPLARFETGSELAQALGRAATGAGLLPAPSWQVAAWVREHVEARQRGAEAHLSAARWREQKRRGFARVPEVAPMPRQSDLSLAASAARARAQGSGAGQRTPTPLAGAGDALGATSTADALGRLDAALAPYERSGENAADEAAPSRPSGERRLRKAEIAGLVLALLAMVAIAFALFAMGGEPAESGEGGTESGRVVPAQSRLVS